MTTYKGIGYDSGKYVTATSSGDDIEFGSQITANQGIAVTNGVSTDTLSTTGNASVGGNLTVTGDIVSKGVQNLVVQDPVIDLGLGNDSTTAQAGGYSLTMNKASSFTTETITACTAGVLSTSAPTLTASATTSFSADDVLCLIDSINSSNNGLYVVDSVSGTTITLKGTGGTAIFGGLPFAQSQVETTTGDSAKAFKVDLYVQIVADGSANFKDANGSNYAKGKLIEKYQASVSQSNFESSGSAINGAYQLVGSGASSLQSAYAGGQTITTTGNPIAFTLSNGNFNVNSGSIDFGGTTPLSNFNLDSATMAIDTTSTTSMTMTANVDAERVLTISAVNSNAGGSASAKLSLQADDNVSIIQNAKALVTAISGATTVKSSENASNTAQTLTLQSEATSSGQGGTVLIQSTVGSGNSAGTVNLQALQAGTGVATINSIIGGTGGVGNNGTFLKMQQTQSTFGHTVIFADSPTYPNAGFKIGSSGQAITSISTNTSLGSSDSALPTQNAVKTYVDNAIPTVDQDLNIAGDSGTGTVNLATQTLTIDTGTNLTTTASGQTITIDLDGAVDLATSLAIQSGQAITSISTATDLGGGSASDSSLATQLAIKTYVDTQVQPLQSLTILTESSGAGVTAGDVVAIDGSGEGILASNASASTATVIGICVSNDAGTLYIQQVGKNTDVTSLGAGAKQYLGTSGGITTTAPSASGTVVYQIGYGDSNGNLIVVPQFIIENP